VVFPSIVASFSGALVRNQRSLGFGDCGKGALRPKNMKRAAILVGATTRNNIGVIASFPCSLLLRVHLLVAFNRVCDSTAS
jgi:hypothetical protein